MLADTGRLDIDVPHVRAGTFEQPAKKRQRRLASFDDKLISLYVRGVTTRGIQSHLEGLYGAEVSPTIISLVTDAVLYDLKAWQSRPLEALYPSVYCDCLIVKSRQDSAVYLALAINLQCEKELLGLWVAQSEGTKFWLSVLFELKNRGVRDCFIACVDGLNGFPESIKAVFPQTAVQLCIVHKVRASLHYVLWKERMTVAADLWGIYGAATPDEAKTALTYFVETWDAKYLAIARTLRADWTHLTAFFEYLPDIRKVIYTTNDIKSLNHSLRKIIKKPRHLPGRHAIVKLQYLAQQNAGGAGPCRCGTGRRRGIGS